MNRLSFYLILIFVFDFPDLALGQSLEQFNITNTKLICNTKSEISTLVFAIPDGVEDKDFHDFTDTISLTRSDTSLNLYTLLIYGNGIKARKDVWINGNDVCIYYSLKDGIQIDSIVNSQTSAAIAEYFKMELTREFNLDSLNAFLFDQLKVFYTSVFSTEIAKMIIRYNFGNFELLERLQTELEQQEPNIKKHKFSQNEKLKGILAFKDLNIGDLVLANKDSVSATIKFDTTQYTLVDFWFSACPPCLRDHKLLMEKYSQFKDKSVQIVGISNDQDFQKWKHTIDIHQHPWANYIETDSNSKIIRFANSFPSYYVLDRQGNIVKYSIRIEEILYFLGI